MSSSTYGELAVLVFTTLIIFLFINRGVFSVFAATEREREGEREREKNSRSIVGCIKQVFSCNYGCPFFFTLTISVL